ncbi:MAG TPA: glycoside hydrolase family 3 C-terminal domain-containing protein [Acidobacteriaceae bacterium]|nr:glycoside hydrolase family 3 C-terminal domain-containing protein [Acidobacteriaceae bacterium]
MGLGARFQLFARQVKPKSRFAGKLLLLSTVLGAGVTLSAQAPHPLTPAEQQHIDDILHKMTLAEKLDYIGGTGFAVRAMPGLDLPALEMSDGPYGVRSNAGLPSTTYSEGIGLAASWDRTLAGAVGAGIGRDARARGIHYMLGPGTNIYRSPRNGRNFEYFGEDPFLAGQMDIGYITGMQGQGVSATVKHYIGNNSEYLRHDSDSVIDERTLREIYLPPFEAAVKQAHVGAVMDSYNLINGLHATQNPVTNIDILRHDWHFPGTLMSDWDATYDAVGAANGGLDIEMPTGKFMNRAKLTPAIQSGAVSEATIEEKIRHILTSAEMFGWLDRPQRDLSIPLYDARDNAIALQSARESVTLLKNDGALLPLNKQQIHTVLVVGPNAYPGTPVGGGSAGVVPFHLTSLVEGVGTVAPAINVLYDPGLPTLTDLAAHTDFTTAESGGGAGLTEEVFANQDLSGAPQRQLTPKHVNNTGIGWDSISGNLDDLMALFDHEPAATSYRYTGYFHAGQEGRYLIALACGGEGNGVRVLIDGHLVIDNWKYVRAFEPHLVLPLTPGAHKVVVEAWQKGPIGGRLRLAIKPEDSVVNPHALELAAHADAVIVAAGFYNNHDVNTESEGGDRTFDLPFGQDELIRAMEAVNSKTIVAVTSGGAVDASGWIDHTPAFLEAWYGGQAGGRALAEVLFGEVNPAGHLPITWERRAEDNPTFHNYYPQDDGIAVQYKEGIFVGYRGYEKNGVQPLFPFGYGLSYTSFSFAGLKVTPGSGPTLATAEFDVTNTGRRAGATVAQVYLSEPGAREPRPAHELKGFERVELAPGQTRHISVPLDARSFAWFNPTTHNWTIDPGSFTVSVGESLATLPLTGTVNISPSTARAASLPR